MLRLFVSQAIPDEGALRTFAGIAPEPPAAINHLLEGHQTGRVLLAQAYFPMSKWKAKL